MKTKTILKTLAVALLMPAMLLTTACSSDDNIIDSEKSANTKGYALPVTVNVTRQGDEGTRATYTDNGNGTGSLGFSAGDQLFVFGSHSTAGIFQGTLTWQSGGTFSGTLTTGDSYDGTAQALLESADFAGARLLPADYDDYDYFYFDPDTGFLETSDTKAFATSKATAVAQFSLEEAKEYSSGFALKPRNAILNFTISGLTPGSHNVEVWGISGAVTANGSGVATFAVGVDGGTYSEYINLLVDDTDYFDLDLYGGTDTPLEAGHIYNISRSVAPAVPAGALNGEFTINSNGDKVNFSKGNLQATYNGTDWTWAFAANQWDYIGNAEGNTKVSASTPFVSGYSGSSTTVDLFGWVGASSTWMDVAQYGITSSSATNNTNGYGNNASEALKSDWGNTIGSGWRTLTSDEWQWMLGPYSVTPNPGTNCRTSSTIGGVANARWVKAVVHSTKGLIIYPDALTWNDATMGTAPTTSNTANNDFTYNTLTDDQWSALEAAGCVFLPAAGYRSQATVAQVGSRGCYWSSSSDDASYAYRVYITSSNLNPAHGSNRYGGNSVRLVREVE